MSGKFLEDNEVADSAVAGKINADSATSNEDKSMPDAQLGNNIVISVEFEDGKAEETNRNATGGEKTLTDNNDGEHTTMLDLNGDYMIKLHQNLSEDEDDEDDDLWEDHADDSEEEDEEAAIDLREASEEEEETDGEYDEEDSEGNDEEIAHDEDGVSEKKEEEEEEEKKGENAAVEKEIANTDERKAEEPNVEKVEAKLKVNKSKGKREKNMGREESSKKPDTTDKSKSKSSTKKKTKKRVESMGMIFMCSSITKNDCFKYMVLGQSESKKNLVDKIYPGMRLFLYDVDLRLMYGIFKARERGGYNIEPKAFKSKFPSQVRFTVLTDCLPLPEERFKKVIKENYFTKKKFDCQLNSEQVKNLCKLFESTSKGQQPKKLPRSRKLEKQPISIRQEGSRKRRAGDERRLPERKEIRYIERPRKLPRKALSLVARSRQPLSPQVSVPLSAMEMNLDVDHYRRDPYIESRSRDPYCQDPHESRRDRPIERGDPYLEHSREPYLDGRDICPDQRNPYRDGRDPRLDLHAPYTETRDSYSDRHIHYRDVLDQYSDTRDPYRNDRGAYVERRVYTDDDPYRRYPLLKRRYVYREDRGEEVHRDSYRSQGVLDRPLSLECRRRYEVVNQDPYASSYGVLPSNSEPFYSSQYPSRTYHL